MSDGMTEAARDQERAEAYESYLGALTDWLENRPANHAGGGFPDDWFVGS